MEHNDWDLQAVVRSCGYAGSSSAAQVKEEEPPPQPSTSLTRFAADYFVGRTHQPSPFIGFEHQLHLYKHQQQQQQQVPAMISFPSAQPPPTPLSRRRSLPHASRTKKSKKSQVKKVVREVPVADGLAADMWAWRKYGQKPIKGSPFPRGYYRCSSSKACMARKQVERKRSDPTVLIVTYTGDHCHAVPTHRNSLAGVTRQKPLALIADSSDPAGRGTEDVLLPNNPTQSPPSTTSAPEFLTCASGDGQEDEEEREGQDIDMAGDYCDGDDDFWDVEVDEDITNMSFDAVFGDEPTTPQSMFFQL